MLPGDPSLPAPRSTSSPRGWPLPDRAASLLLVVVTTLATALGVQLVQAPTAAAAPHGTPSTAPAAPSRTATPSPAASSKTAKAVSGPTVVDDVGTMSVGSDDVTLPGAGNDVAGSAALRFDRTVFPADQLASLSGGSSISDDGRRLTYFGFGVFTLNGGGRISFDPNFGISGQRTVRYRITDLNGLSAEGLATVIVTAGGQYDSVDIKQGRPGTVDLLANDTPGRNADGSRGSLDRTSVRFTAQQDAPVTVSADRRKVTFPTVGTFTIDPTTGLMTFAPELTYVSTEPGYDLFYSAQDTTTGNGGAVEHHAYTSVFNWTVTPIERLVVSQHVSPKSFDHVGQVLTWTATVANYGPTPISGLTLTELPDRLSARTCTPVPVGGTLASGASTTCTATSTVRQEDFDQRYVDLADTVTVRGTTTQDGRTITTSARASTTAGGFAHQRLSLATSTSPTTVSRVGQVVDYTFVAKNTGNRSLHNLVVSAPFPGLSALVCAPVPQGGTLGDSQTTTCRATRTITAANLKGAALTSTAKATAVPTDTGHVTASNATSTVTVAAKALAPRATDDTVPAVDGGPDVILPGATNDGPGESGGPGLDPSRTVFDGVAADPVYGAKVATTTQGSWSILPNGSVRFSPGRGHPGTTAQIAYRVYDQAGRSAVARLRVPLRPGPTARPHHLAVVQGGSVAVNVMKLDDPGQNADGTPASFVRFSLKLTGVSRTAGLGIDYIYDRSSIRIDGVGDFVVDPHQDLAIVYDGGPYPTVSLDVPTLSYSMLTTAGTQVTGTVSVDITPTTGVDPSPRELPEALFDGAVTTPQVPVVLTGQTNDLPGVAPLDSSKVSFPRDQIQFLPAGTTITDVGGEQVLNEPGQGTFRTHRADGTVLFTPDPGFQSPDDIPGSLGSVVAEYTIADTAGNTSRAYLSVGLVPGASARADAVTTRQGRSVNANVLLNDYAGRSQLSGAPGTFADPRLTTTGLPSGATVSASGSRLTVPGQGVYSVSPGDRTVTFVPEPRFRGTATPVTYALRTSVPRLNLDPAILNLTAKLTVTVVGTDPVARADTASTTVGHPVVVPVLGNDSPGSSVVPLVGSSVRLRLAAGLPTGSALSGDAKTLVVAGRGVFLVAGTGQITFVGLGTATGAVPTVGYQVADANGTTARSTLTVTVR